VRIKMNQGCPRKGQLLPGYSPVHVRKGFVVVLHYMDRQGLSRLDCAFGRRTSRSHVQYSMKGAGLRRAEVGLGALIRAQ